MHGHVICTTRVCFRISTTLPSGAAAMAPKPRALHETPSCPSDLHPLQVTLLASLTNVYQNYRETGETLRQMCHEYQVAYSSEGAPRARAAEVLRQVGVDDPNPWLSWANNPEEASQTTVLQWSYAPRVHVARVPHSQPGTSPL